MMKKINWEKGLVRIAWTLSILAGTVGFFVFLIYCVDDIFGLFIGFVLISPLLLASTYALAKLCFLFLGIVLFFLLILFFVKGFRNDGLDKQQVTSTTGRKKINRRIVISVLVIIATVGGGGSYLLHYWYYQIHTGSRDGQVIDVVTGKPIEGAVVTYHWGFSDFMTMGGGKAAFYETTTDKDGYYFVPNQRVAKRTLIIDVLGPESVLIYKDKYGAYELYREYGKPPMSRSFGYWFPENSPKDQLYRKKNNLVKLYPMKNGDSHQEHIGWIRSITSGDTIGPLLMKELEQEPHRAEKKP